MEGIEQLAAVGLTAYATAFIVLSLIVALASALTRLPQFFEKLKRPKVEVEKLEAKPEEAKPSEDLAKVAIAAALALHFAKSARRAPATYQPTTVSGWLVAARMSHMSSIDEFYAYRFGRR